MKRNNNGLKNLNVKAIRRFFGFDSKIAFLKKSIKVSPMTKLEWLEEIRQSICRLPLRIRKQVVKELRYLR